MSTKATKVAVPDGTVIRVPLYLVDSAVQTAVHELMERTPVGARDAAHRAMIDGLSTAWQGDRAVAVAYGDAEATFQASAARAQAVMQRLADSRPDATAAHAAMVAGLSEAWKGAA